MLEVPISPLRIQPIEEKAFTSPRGIHDHTLPVGQIGLFQFLQSFAARPGGIARERLKGGVGGYRRFPRR